MKTNIIKFENDYPKLSEVLRFLIVGTIATIIDMFVMGIVLYLTNQSSYNSIVDVFFTNGDTNSLVVVIATAIGFIVGLIINYYASIFYVYRGENNYAKTKKGFILFAWLSVIGLLIQTIGMYIGYSVFNINEWLIKIILVLVVLIFNYFTRKIFIFKSKQEIEKKEKTKQTNTIYKTSIKEIILNVCFIISSVGLMLLLYIPLNGKLSKYNDIFMVLYIIATIIITSFVLFFIFKRVLFKINLKNKKLVIISAIMTIVTLYALFNFSILSSLERILCVLLSSYCLYIYIYAFNYFILNRSIRFWKLLNITERRLFVITSITFLCLGLVILCFSKVFVAPSQYYDAVFSFDTGYQIQFKTQLNVLGGENDFRHFLMTLTQLPFSIIPYLIYCILPYDVIYGFSLFLVQCVLISYIVINLIKLINISNKTTLIFIYLSFIVSAGFIFNTLIVEKFIFALFYVVATLKLCQEEHDAKWLTLLGSIGSLTTNLILLPIVVFYKKKSIQDYFDEVITFIIFFVMVMVISGSMNLVINTTSYDATINFSSSGTNVGFIGKLIQTLTFISSVFICPMVVVKETGSINQASSTFGIFAIIGLILLICIVVSAIINWHNKFSRICTLWNIFMIILLLIIGWGSVLDEMFIYSLIFGWSIISALVMLFNKLKINNKLKLVIASSLLIVIAGWNIYSLIKITSLARLTYTGLLVF